MSLLQLSIEMTRTLSTSSHICHLPNFGRRHAVHAKGNRETSALFCSYQHSSQACSSRIAAHRGRGRDTHVMHAAKEAAELRELGSSGLEIPAVCLGTMTFGGQNTEEEAASQLNYALDHGVNFIDTAEIYPVPPNKESQGSTDRYIGSWLKSVQRDKIILATKVAGYGNAYLRGGDTISRVTPDQIKESVDSSLARLGTDYIDLLQVHWPDRHVGLFGREYYDPSKARWEEDIPFEEQLQGLAAVVEAGKVRHIGVSNETSYGVMRFVQAAMEHANLPRIVSIQNNYSMLVRTHFDIDLGEVCHRNNENVALLAYSPLAGGSLTGKYVDGSATSKSRFNMFEGYMARYNKSPARQAVTEYMKVASKYGLTPTQLALAWCNQRWTVTSTIIGATTLDQLKENVDAFSIELPEEALKDIERVHFQYRDPSNRPLDE